MAGREGLGIEEMDPSAREMTIRDMGGEIYKSRGVMMCIPVHSHNYISLTVPVALNEEQLVKRQQDFVHRPKLQITDHSATPSERAIVSPCYMDGTCQSLNSGLRDWRRKRGHGTKRANVLLVQVRKQGKVLKLRARSRRLISRLTSGLGEGRFAHTVVAKHIRIGGKLPWGLVHWYSLQLHTATTPPQVRRVRLHKRDMLKQRCVQRSDNSEQDGRLATGRGSVQALQRQFTLEMEDAETCWREGSEEANDGVWNEDIDAQTAGSSRNVLFGRGTDGTAASHKIHPTSSQMNHDDIEEIFSMLGASE